MCTGSVAAPVEEPPDRVVRKPFRAGVGLMGHRLLYSSGPWEHLTSVPLAQVPGSPATVNQFSCSYAPVSQSQFTRVSPLKRTHLNMSEDAHF